MRSEFAAEMQAEQMGRDDDGDRGEWAVRGFVDGNFAGERGFEVGLERAAKKFAWRQRENLVISKHGNENSAKVYHTAVGHHADFLVGHVHVCSAAGANYTTAQRDAGEPASRVGNHSAIYRVDAAVCIEFHVADGDVGGGTVGVWPAER